MPRKSRKRSDREALSSPVYSKKQKSRSSKTPSSRKRKEAATPVSSRKRKTASKRATQAEKRTRRGSVRRSSRSSRSLRNTKQDLVAKEEDEEEFVDEGEFVEEGVFIEGEEEEEYRDLISKSKEDMNGSQKYHDGDDDDDDLSADGITMAGIVEAVITVLAGWLLLYLIPQPVGLLHQLQSKIGLPLKDIPTLLVVLPYFYYVIPRFWAAVDTLDAWCRKVWNKFDNGSKLRDNAQLLAIIALGALVIFCAISPWMSAEINKFASKFPVNNGEEETLNEDIKESYSVLTGILQKLISPGSMVINHVFRLDGEFWESLADTIDETGLVFLGVLLIVQGDVWLPRVFAGCGFMSGVLMSSVPVTRGMDIGREMGSLIDKSLAETVGVLSIPSCLAILFFIYGDVSAGMKARTATASVKAMFRGTAYSVALTFLASFMIGLNLAHYGLGKDSVEILSGILVTLLSVMVALKWTAWLYQRIFEVVLYGRGFMAIAMSILVSPYVVIQIIILLMIPYAAGSLLLTPFSLTDSPQGSPLMSKVCPDEESDYCVHEYWMPLYWIILLIIFCYKLFVRVQIFESGDNEKSSVISDAGPATFAVRHVKYLVLMSFYYAMGTLTATKMAMDKLIPMYIFESNTGCEGDNWWSYYFSKLSNSCAEAMEREDDRVMVSAMTLIFVSCEMALLTSMLDIVDAAKLWTVDSALGALGVLTGHTFLINATGGGASGSLAKMAELYAGNIPRMLMLVFGFLYQRRQRQSRTYDPNWLLKSVSLVYLIVPFAIAFFFNARDLMGGAGVAKAIL